jgi:putative hydrolase of the HAD superfamily
MAKTILILDFGGVITKTIFEQHRVTERILGLPPGTLTWLGPLDLETDELWRRMLRGELTENEYWITRAREVGRLVGETWNDIRILLRRTCSNPSTMLRPEAITAIHKLTARGVRLAVLSNELDRFYGRDFRSSIDLLSKMDVILDGTYTNIFKPDPRAYELCLQVLGADMAEAVFVDDHAHNVEGARRIGLDAIRFDVRNPVRSYAEIEAIFLK